MSEKTTLNLRAKTSGRNIIKLDGKIIVGGTKPMIIAGPCSVESLEQVLRTAATVKKAGAKFFRGGAFKPRTAPQDFQGHGKLGLQMLAKVREKFGLYIVTEVLDTEDISIVSDYADVLQIGSRNMQNTALLKKLGKQNKPVLLKRGLCATYKEWIGASKYILDGGNPNVILCERGIRSGSGSDGTTRNVLDLQMVIVALLQTNLSVIVDPSHAAGRRDIIFNSSMASMAAGAHGLIIEVHPNPPEALSDSSQQLYPRQFELLMKHLPKKVAPPTPKEFLL